MIKASWLGVHVHIRDDMTQVATPDHTFFYGHTPSKYPSGIKHYVFSQWWPCHFVDAAGTAYTSAEQYMMAKKAELFGDQKMLESILSTSDPKRIKSYGRKVANFDEGTWVQARYDIVVQGNWLKFSQDKGLKAILLGTGQTLLVEAAPTDSIWGIGLSEANAWELPESQWPGSNLLGKALTQVREALRAAATAEGRQDTA